MTYAAYDMCICYLVQYSTYDTRYLYSGVWSILMYWYLVPVPCSNRVANNSCGNPGWEARNTEEPTGLSYAYILHPTSRTAHCLQHRVQSEKLLCYGVLLARELNRYLYLRYHRKHQYTTNTRYPPQSCPLTSWQHHSEVCTTTLAPYQPTDHHPEQFWTIQDSPSRLGIFQAYILHILPGKCWCSCFMLILVTWWSNRSVVSDCLFLTQLWQIDKWCRLHWSSRLPAKEVE